MVIQRIQSLFLLLASIFMGIFSFMPIIDIETKISKFSLSPLELKNCNLLENSNMASVLEANFAAHTWLYFSVCLAITILIFATIFMFKNLKRQKKFVLLSLFLVFCYYISTWIYSYFILQRYDATNWSLTVYSFFPILSIVFLMLAVKGINKDKKLLADSFRIR